MYRLLVLAGVLSLAVVVAQVQAQDKDTKSDKPKSIGAIMKKAHAGDEALRSAVTKALKAKDFDKALSPMKAWVALATHLNTFDPPRGNKESWKKLTKEYGQEVTGLAKAIQRKDTDAALATLKVINASCGDCHKAHRPKKK
jgi:cytochrome c556